jgi:transposase-like protein
MAKMPSSLYEKCPLHALAKVPKEAQQMVGATIRTVFAQPDAESAHQQWRRVADGFRDRFSRLAGLMDEAEEDVLAYAAFPKEHWQKLWSNNPLERLNKEVKRRTEVVGIFPDEAAVIRLVGAILNEQHDDLKNVAGRQAILRRRFVGEAGESARRRRAGCSGAACSGSRLERVRRWNHTERVTQLTGRTLGC